MKFLPIKVDIKNKIFCNVKYISFAIDLLFRNKNMLINDYYPKSYGELLDFMIEEINAAYPWFVVGISGDIPVGVAWFTHWHKAGENNYHSCQLHACIDKKFWGKPSIYATEQLMDFVVKNTGIKRIQMEIPEFNKIAIAYAKRAGFKEEGVLICAAVKSGKPCNHILFSRIFL